MKINKPGECFVSVKKCDLPLSVSKGNAKPNAQANKILIFFANSAEVTATLQIPNFRQYRGYMTKLKRE